MEGGHQERVHVQFSTSVSSVSPQCSMCEQDEFLKISMTGINKCQLRTQKYLKNVTMEYILLIYTDPEKNHLSKFVVVMFP